MTIVYPNSVPVAVRADTGIDIINVTGDDLSTPTPIPRSIGYTVALITYGTGNAVLLPDDAVKGDVVECHGLSGGNTAVLAPNGETINGSTNSFNFGSSKGVIIRKVSSTDWRSL